MKAWVAAGPQTGHLRLAPYLRRIADRDLLKIDNAESAAVRPHLLTVTDINQQTFHGAVPLPQKEITQLVTLGVQAFLRSYAPTTPKRTSSGTP
ncbi:TetR/AcrR family transcriptional regulator C-terminal domain-containing protein [Actinomadura sp. NPDC048955]|uniref:TetR/AcrR family transcriptional regulator C-terminal domain-containing protein n=1 Tax=Actinomadura sp. NPDC048955 TaxID=3158228 RepID=UPI0033D8B58B